MNRTDLNSVPHPSYYGLEAFKNQVFSSKLQTTSSSSSSSIASYYLFSNVTHDRGHYCCGSHQQLGLEQEGGSDDHSLAWRKENEDTNTDDQSDHTSAHWISSNMSSTHEIDQSNAMKLPIETIMPIFGDHNKQTSYSSLENENHSNTSSNITIRVCSDCNTTKTPLWRSGPRGPKSLCNACGIRQRKARRAMAAAASGTILATTNNKSKGLKKEHKSSTKRFVASEFKKKCKPATSSSSGGKTKNKLRFEDFIRISLRKHSAFHRFFPQDEKEAAILLMALSSGLVHG